MSNAVPARVLLSKIGLDGHDRGLRMIAHELRDRGAEVVVLGLGATADLIARTAAEEDVDVVGISILSGAHLSLIPSLLRSLTDLGVPEIPVVCGGTIPKHDRETLAQVGVAAVRPVGTPVCEAADTLMEVAREYRGRAKQTIA